RESAPARDRAGLRDAHRRLSPRACRLRRTARSSDADRRARHLRRRDLTVRRAVLFVALVVLAWLVWDTGADPVRLARGLPWCLDFLRRMMPPDPSVLPAALLGAIKIGRASCRERGRER